MSKIMRVGTNNPATTAIQEEGKIRWWRALIYWGIALSAAYGMSHAPSWLGLEEKARDTLMAQRLERDPALSQVLLVDFDDASIQSLGGWPVKRDLLAELVEELLGLGARVVALDMVFPERGDAAGDMRLASLAENAPLVLSHALDLDERLQPIHVGELAAHTTSSTDLVNRWTAAPSYSYVANHEGLRRARCVGHIAMRPDPDGILRRLPPLVETPHGRLAMLSAAMLDCAGALPSTTPLARHDNSTTAWRLPFAFDNRFFEAVSAAEVLTGQLSAERMRGRYVLVGSSALGLSDYINTPLQPLTPGVLVHAQALAEMLAHGLPEVDRTGPVLAWVALGVMLGLVWLAWLRNKPAAWLVLAMATALWAVLLLQLYPARVFPAALMPVTAVGLALTCITLLELKLIRDSRQRALTALSFYLAGPVLKQLCQQGLAHSLEPRLSKITVLVVDMRNYTAMTEQLPLEELAALIKDFLELMTQPVLEHEGTLDSYSGDGLIAFWGAPLERADHADAALACALDMRQRLQDWNALRNARGLPALGIRMGLESGLALVGDLGSTTRSVYTAVGSCINVAARLQELGRDLGNDLVIGPKTAARCKQPLQPLGEMPIRGLHGLSALYTVPAKAGQKEVSA